MSWINKILPSIGGSGGNSSLGKQKSSVPSGLWKKCPRCEAVLYRPDLERNLDVCPKCEHHLRISARRRLELFLDPDEQQELYADVAPVDLLKFKDLKKYKDRLSAAQKSTGEKDALIVVRGRVNNLEMVVAAFEFGFIGGSMGAVVGEKFVKAVETCLESGLPLVCFSTSGGARMQEALISLMQMAKTSAAIRRLRDNGIPFISVLVDPVYGGVSASLAMLGDINIAEPNALVGFTGPDVIRQTVRVKLPDGFQRSEFLLEHGAIDMIVHRHDLRDRVPGLISKLMHLSPVIEPAEQIPAPISEVAAAELESVKEALAADAAEQVDVEKDVAQQATEAAESEVVEEQKASAETEAAPVHGESEETATQDSEDKDGNEPRP